MAILIIGIGNEYRSDDAVGLQIADSLTERNYDSCTIKKTSGEGITLINLWESFDHVILVDAVKSGKTAGTIHRIDLLKEEIQTEWFQKSSHLFALPEAVQLGKTLNKLPQTMHVFGIEGDNFEFGLGLSPEVEKAKDNLLQIIDSEITLAVKQTETVIE